MTRSNAREIAVHIVFGMDYTDQTPEQLLADRFEAEYYRRLAEETEVYQDKPNEKQMLYIRAIVQGVFEKREQLDGEISRYAIGWNLSRISGLAKAIMRVCMYEVLFVDDIPASASISEAVELSRKYEDEETVSFVNGILGSFSRGLAE